MTVFDGAREDWEAAAPRPRLLVARWLVEIALGIVCALVTVAWLVVLL